MGIFADADDYRVPDLVVYDHDAESERGIDGAPALVVEVRSPRDESFEKLPWYLAHGAGAVLIVDRDSLAFELHTVDGKVAHEPDRSVLVESLGVRISGSDGNLLVDGVAIEL